MTHDINLTPEDEKQICCPNSYASNITKLVHLSLKILGMRSVQCNQKRHLDLRYKLVPSAKELADKAQQTMPLLFYDNLKENYCQTQETNCLTNFIVPKKPKNFSAPRYSTYNLAFLA